MTHPKESKKENDPTYGDTNKFTEKVCHIEFPLDNEEEVNLDHKVEFMEN